MSIDYRSNAISNHDLYAAKERALLEQFSAIAERLDRLEASLSEFSGREQLLSDTIEKKLVPKDRIGRIEDRLNELAKNIAETDKRAQRMRIDRQFRLFPTWIKLRLDRSRQITGEKSVQPQSGILNQLMIVCPVYPGGARPYGGEFVEKRAQIYSSQGYQVVVCEVSRGNVPLDRSEHGGIQVYRLSPDDLDNLISKSSPRLICAHQVEKYVWQVLRKYTNEIPTIVWIHGFEARDWRELEFNFTPEEIVKNAAVLEQANVERRETMRELFATNKVAKVFVSKFMRTVARKFAGIRPRNAYVIHNVIPADVFPFKEKPDSQRLRVLWVRSFGAKNYANDLAQKAVLELSRRDIFSNIAITICGDGRFFDEITEPLREFDNVQINQGFVSSKDLAKLHQTHGVMLVPSRWDSQGLTLGEAMSSGLAVITNAVAAIPEFVDNRTGVLCSAEDALGLADGIERIAMDPQMFKKISHAAARRAQAQCGFESTLNKELHLIRKVSPNLLRQNSI